MACVPGYGLDMKNRRYNHPELGQDFVTSFVYTVAVGLAVVYLFGLGGCMPLPEAPIQHNPSLPTKPMQAETIQAVWYDTYGMTKSPPPIYWIEGNDLDCGEGQSFMSYGQCAAGVTILGQGEPYIMVAWKDYDGRKPGNTALAHELCHAIGIETGDYDAQHLGPCFAEGGDLDIAVGVLKHRGLY